MRTRTVLIFWLLAMLFPLDWLRSYSPAYRSAFDAAFGAEWVHVTMHLALFAGLAILILLILKRRLDRSLVVLILAAVLVVGVLQEGLQIAARGDWWGGVLPSSLFDLGIDLLGATVGIVIVFISHKRNKDWI